MQWIPEDQVVYTTKITVATVSVIITTSNNQTWPPRTETVYNYVPPEYSLYSIGADPEGTVVATIPVLQSDGWTTWSEFTYPTPFLDYSTEYQWKGVLQTLDKASNPSCQTAAPEPANVPLHDHPVYPQPTGDVSPGKDDLYGYFHVPLYVSLKDQPDKLFFDVAFPAESAFSYCGSIPASATIPVQFEAPKFVTASTTVWTTPVSEGIVIVQPTATGWEMPTNSWVIPDIPHIQPSASNWNDGTTQSGNAGPTSLATAHNENTVSGFAQSTPGAQQSKGSGPSKIVEIIESVINNDPVVSSTSQSQLDSITGNAAITPTETVITGRTPVFTFIPTVFDGQSTLIPAFILPWSVATATVGQTVTLNGQPTVLVAPQALFIMLPMTVDGTASFVPAYIISGTSTATLGETLTLDGQETVLAAPSLLLTMMPTTINGVATSGPVYLISGSITASLGQTVTLYGQTTVLSVPTTALTWLSTTINGIATSALGYVVSGTSTATIGQVIVIDGTTTVLSAPASSGEADAGFVGPTATSFGAPATGTSNHSQSVGVLSTGIKWSSAMIVFGVAAILWL
jgi:hypothetical protein